MSAEQRIRDLRITLPSGSAPAGNYANTVRSGNLLFISAKAPTHEPAAGGRTDFPSPTGRGWPEGPGEGETARSWVQFVAMARPGGLSPVLRKSGE